MNTPSPGAGGQNQPQLLLTDRDGGPAWGRKNTEILITKNTLLVARWLGTSDGREALWGNLEYIFKLHLEDRRKGKIDWRKFNEPMTI